MASGGSSSVLLYLSVSLLLALASLTEGKVLFSSLNKTLAVTYQIEGPRASQSVVKAGKDSLRVHWNLNSSFAGRDSKYETVSVHLCYAPKSQVNRGWRKTVADLSLDRACKAADVVEQKYTSAGNTTVWKVDSGTPKAFYFVRAYALDATGSQVGFGQTTDKNRTMNLFSVDPESGRHTGLDIAAGVFSAFTVGALFTFLALEKLRARKKGSI